MGEVSTSASASSCGALPPLKPRTLDIRGVDDLKKTIEEIFHYTSDSGVEGSLGIDMNGHLYWNEKPVVTEQRVKLAWWVNVAIVIGGFSTLAIAIFTALSYLGSA